MCAVWEEKNGEDSWILQGSGLRGEEERKAGKLGSWDPSETPQGWNSGSAMRYQAQLLSVSSHFAKLKCHVLELGQRFQWATRALLSLQQWAKVGISWETPLQVQTCFCALEDGGGGNGRMKVLNALMLFLSHCLTEHSQCLPRCSLRCHNDRYHSQHLFCVCLGLFCF